jgi:ribosomal-protein-alanine acetyltransferase
VNTIKKIINNYYLQFNVLNIRHFQPTDMFAVIKLASETLTERYNPIFFNNIYETNPDEFIVVEKAHKLIGFILGIKINKKLAKILMLSVSKQYQNKRVGTKLLLYFLTKVSKEKIKIIELDVRTDNKKAINFYKKNGFKIKEKIKQFYQNGKDAYTMVKQI